MLPPLPSAGWLQLRFYNGRSDVARAQKARMPISIASSLKSNIGVWTCGYVVPLGARPRQKKHAGQHNLFLYPVAQ